MYQMRLTFCEPTDERFELEPAWCAGAYLAELFGPGRYVPPLHQAAFPVADRLQSVEQLAAMLESMAAALRRLDNQSQVE